MSKESKNTYWKDLKEATQTTAKGLSMTWEHFQKSIQSLAKTENNTSGNANAAKNQPFDATYSSNLGVVTNLYPHEMMPIPDNGRYKLHNEIEDCIVCNKCVEVCPVNCIEIDAIRGTEQVGRASDGSPIRFYAAKFDIDMAKCCFCGLCTVVCPTECLTMTKEFDFSETDITKMNYEFGNLTQEEATQKQREWDDFQAEKTIKKVVKTTISKPAQKIKITPTVQSEEDKAIKKPTIKIKKIAAPLKTEQQKEEKNTSDKAKIKPIKIKLPIKKQSTENQNLSSQNEAKKEKEKQEPKIEQKKIIKIKIPKSTNSNKPTNETQKSLESKKNIIKIKLPKQKSENQVTKIDTEKKLPKLEDPSENGNNSDLEKE
ncbi:4Fe-4S dicluster domain-containing protein [Bernardetia sp. MNP-M8]|uniref:4Fe-4S dicluster domain-containing protein n=1 Tax=Bernardetia sp. MNP-M8 TaxID=3127470 RepID=UPI0030D55B3B